MSIRERFKFNRYGHWTEYADKKSNKHKKVKNKHTLGPDDFSGGIIDLDFESANAIDIGFIICHITVEGHFDYFLFRFHKNQKKWIELKN